MLRGFIKLENEEREFYLVWSSLLNAPISRGMSKDQFLGYLNRYEKKEEIPKILGLIEKRGCTFL